MPVDILSAIVSMVGTVIVAIIGLLGVRMQTKSKERQEDIQKIVEGIRKDSKNNVERLSEELSGVELNGLKRFLITELTEAKKKSRNPRLTQEQKERILNEEQKHMLHDAKKRYNELGGDSYVDDMFDDLLKDGIV